MTSFCGVSAAFRTCKTAFERLSAWVHMEPNFLAFELLNVFKWMLEWLPKILRALLVFGSNLHRVMLPVLHLLTFLAAQDVLRLPSQNHHFLIVQTTFGTFARLEHVHYKVMKRNSPQKHFFRHKVRHIWVKTNYCCLRLKWMTYTGKDAQWQ